MDTSVVKLIDISATSSQLKKNVTLLSIIVLSLILLANDLSTLPPDHGVFPYNILPEKGVFTFGFYYVLSPHKSHILGILSFGLFILFIRLIIDSLHEYYLLWINFTESELTFRRLTYIQKKICSTLKIYVFFLITTAMFTSNFIFCKKIFDQYIRNYYTNKLSNLINEFEVTTKDKDLYRQTRTQYTTYDNLNYSQKSIACDYKRHYRQYLEKNASNKSKLSKMHYNQFITSLIITTPLLISAYVALQCYPYAWSLAKLLF